MAQIQWDTGISRMYGVDMSELVLWNGIAPPYILTVGQNLLIPWQTQGESSADDATAIPGVQGKRILRYIAYDNGTALDTETGLMWMRCALGQTWDGRTCRGKGTEMNWIMAKRQRLSFAGYDDWRTPTIEELRTLVYCSNGKPAYFSLGKDADTKDSGCAGLPDKNHNSPTVVQEVFPASPWRFWSDSPYVYISGYAWSMYFNYGDDSYSPILRSDYHVRLVRDGQ